MNTLVIRAYDSAGNIGEICIVFYVDLRPPSVEWTRIPAPYSNEDSVRLEWNATDDVGIRKLILDVNGLQKVIHQQ